MAVRQECESRSRTLRMADVVDRQVLAGKCDEIVDLGCRFEERVLIPAFDAGGVDEAADELE